MDIIHKIMNIREKMDYSNETDVYAMFHELGHYIYYWEKGSQGEYPNLNLENWRKVIRCEVKAWQIGKREYEKYFGKEITQEMKEHSIRCLLTYIYYWDNGKLKSNLMSEISENTIEKKIIKRLNKLLGY